MDMEIEVELQKQVSHNGIKQLSGQATTPISPCLQLAIDRAIGPGVVLGSDTALRPFSLGPEQDLESPNCASGPDEMLLELRQQLSLPPVCAAGPPTDSQISGGEGVTTTKQQRVGVKEIVSNLGRSEAAISPGVGTNRTTSQPQHLDPKKAMWPNSIDQDRSTLSYAAKATTGQTYNHSSQGGFLSAPGTLSKVAKPNPYVDENFDQTAGVTISDRELLTALSHLPGPPTRSAVCWNEGGPIQRQHHKCQKPSVAPSRARYHHIPS